MKEVLSQEDIDQVLAAFSSGRLSAEEKERRSRKQEEIKFYDFRRPNKFSKEQLRTLHMLHDNFARLLSSFLSGYLRTKVQFSVTVVEQLTYDEFVRSIPVPTVLSFFSMKPLKGAAIVETNPQFLFPVIDLLFGGPGIMPKRLRDFTDIELSVIRKLNAKILENLALTWADVFPVTPEIESIETNPLLHQIVSPNEIIALITLSCLMGDSKDGIIALCFPYIVLDPVISQLSAHYRFSESASPGGEDAQQLKHWLGRSTVEITAVAGEAQITVQDFLHLQAGDVLPLERKIGRDMDLYIDDRLKFKVQAGTLGRYLAVQIVSLVEEGDADV